MAGQIVLTGNQLDAKYSEQQIKLYKHNPFIEALPPLLEIVDVAKRISRRPYYNEEERLLPPLQRIHMVQTIDHFIEPLPIHIDLEARFSRMIRSGYVARNPMEKEFVKQMREGFRDLIWGTDDGYKPLIRSTASGFAIIGPSGIGKTTSIESVLGLYPQVITHSKYGETDFMRQQLVWLKLDCPRDGSIKGMCLNFFQSVDKVLKTNYYKKFSSRTFTVDTLLPEMGNLAFNLGLGVLVIDEIQRLSDGKSGGQQQMINAFVQLINTIGVPVVTIGTFKAFQLLQKEFATARRASGQGDMIWFNAIKDEIWDEFIESLWEYQWTNVKTPLTKALNDAIYDESQGIIDIAVKLYKLAQWRVIGEDYERITVSIIKQVAKDSLRLVRPMLEALRNGRTEDLKLIPDVQPMFNEMDEYYKKATERVAIFGVGNDLKNQQSVSKGGTNDEVHSPLVRIAQWLVDAGVDPKIAKLASEKALALHGDEFEISAAMHHAYQYAMDYSSINQGNMQPLEENKEKAIKGKKSLIELDEIREIFDQDKQATKDLLGL
ncbi:ATP-binding protein [Bacillus sp. DJP31]|uniref:ATP-binding protein n=1 Tax=Bacillus sp. DJP31 TaxID=3409789 RepID=UPI003BB62F8D